MGSTTSTGTNEYRDLKPHVQAQDGNLVFSPPAPTPTLAFKRCSGKPETAALTKELRKGILKGRSKNHDNPDAVAESTIRRILVGLRLAKPAKLGNRIRFAQKVKVIEYSRLLGGSDAVPQDGSVLPLGLGKRRRCFFERLAATPSRRFGKTRRESFEDRCYVLVDDRKRMLRKSMGNVAYSMAWMSCKQQILRTIRSRKESKLDLQTKDFEYMPESMAEARCRAQWLSQEVRTGMKRFSCAEAEAGETCQERRQMTCKSSLEIRPLQRKFWSEPDVAAAKTLITLADAMDNQSVVATCPLGLKKATSMETGGIRAGKAQVRAVPRPRPSKV